MKILKKLPIGLLLASGILKAQTLPTTPIYQYSVPNAGPNAGYAPNGNLTSYTDSVTGTWNMQYDPLNRLHTATAAAGVYQGLGLDWEYDSFGNRLSQTPSGSSSANVPVAAYATYGPNNQMWTNNAAPVRVVDSNGNVISGVVHDAAGNMTYDGRYNLAYDAESRVCAVYDTLLGGNITQYLYNAEGQRVAKGYPATGTTTPVCAASDFVATATYIVGPNGEQVTELAVTNGISSWQHSNVYAGGQLLATYDQEGTTQPLHFNVTDALGTKRIQATGGGAVELACLSLPYGDGLNCSGSGQDATEHHFTGKERDTESGLDYFGARYYASSMGRFMSPDWAAKVSPVPYAKLDDPQSLNLYAYVRNNPLSRADLDGHSDYLWQKTKNWVEGNGFKTNAQVQGLSVAQTAQTHTGSTDWAINSNNSSGKDVGHPQDFHSGQDKCNQYVGDTLAEAGKTRPEITDANGNTRMPNAHELADPSVHIPGLSDTKPLSEAQPGDVIAQQHGDVYGHTGIVVGPGQTSSANATGSYGGQITVNDWGFRPAGGNGESGRDPAPVVRTPQ
jgi:RHS repeat-associated protein